MTSQQIFTALVYLCMPAALLYPLVYGLSSPWWRTWIGRALFIKAIGVLILLTQMALFQLFGPNYWLRDQVRIFGMSLVCIGTWTALFALVQVLRSSGGWGALFSLLSDRRNR